jgi:hypothetical protein
MNFSQRSSRKEDFDDVADMVVAAGPIAAFAWRHECHVGRATAARWHAAKRVRNDHPAERSANFHGDVRAADADVYDDLVSFYSLGAMTGHGAPPVRANSIAGTVS